MRTLLWYLAFSISSIICHGAKVSSDAYRVTGLKKFGAEDEMYAGHMALDLEHPNTEGSFFFWLAKQRNQTHGAAPKKLVFWLNGGPGCSSMVGMMWENGPFNIFFGGENEAKYSLRKNPNSWNEIADVVFVEQPIRTGFSLAAEGTPIIRTEAQIGADFRKFLVSFLKVFPEYKGVELFLSGESYAGFYIPWIADAIVTAQIKKLPGGFFTRDVSVDHINLVGAAIGNGIIDVFHQEPSYAEYAYTHGLIPLGAKKKIDADWVECMDQLERQRAPITARSVSRCNMMDKVLKAAGKPNEYDTSTFNGYDHIMSADGAFTKFFQDPEVQLAIHVRGNQVPGINFIPENYHNLHNITYVTSYEDPAFYFEPPSGWSVCNDDIETQMGADGTSVVPELQFLADFTIRYPQFETAPVTEMTKNHAKNAVKLLLYSGEFDLNCNTLGTLHTLEANFWRNKPWVDADRSLWRSQTDVAGEYFTIDNIFSFLIVRNSGHLLPMDIPQNALEMITRFLNYESFADVTLPNERSYMDQLQPILSAPSPIDLTTMTTSPIAWLLWVFGIVEVSVALLAISIYYLHREKINIILNANHSTDNKVENMNDDETAPFLLSGKNKQQQRGSTVESNEPSKDMKSLHASWFAYFDTESDEESTTMSRYYHTKESK